MSKKLDDTLAMVEAPNKQKPISKYNKYAISKEDLDNYLQHNLTLMKWQKISLDDAYAVKTRVEKYFDLCVKDQTKPSASGLATALGITTQTLFNIKDEVSRVGKPESEIIKQAYQVLEMMWEDYMLNNQIHPVAGIFLSKNQFGYVDTREVVVNTKKVETVDTDEMRRKYLSSIPEAEIVKN